MTHEWNQFDQRLDAYIDDLLAGDERAQFEQRISGDPQAAVMVRLRRELNVQIRRAFEPPPVPAWATAPRLGELRSRLNGRVAVPVPMARRAPQPIAVPRRRLPWSRQLAAAAAIVLAAVGMWLAWQSIRPSAPTGYASGEWRSLEQAYAELEQPEWVCDSDAEFLATFVGRFGQPLLFTEPPGEPCMAGLAYCHSISRDTVCMVGSADETSRIVVFIDRLEKNTKPSLPADSGLHLHRRELGKLVLYEVSPKDHPILLNWFYIPEGGARP